MKNNPSHWKKGMHTKPVKKTIVINCFTGEELESARLSYVNSLHSVPDSLSGLESWYLTQILLGRSDTPEEAAAAMAGITREEVIAAAKKVTLDTVYFLASKGGEKEDSEDE